jgi:hypothetical protein
MEHEIFRFVLHIDGIEQIPGSPPMALPDVVVNGDPRALQFWAADQVKTSNKI